MPTLMTYIVYIREREYKERKGKNTDEKERKYIMN